MTEDKKQADKIHDDSDHLNFEEHDRLPSEIFEAIAALNMHGATKTEVMFRQRKVIEMFLNRIDPAIADTPDWTIYDGLAVEAWKAKKLPPKPKRGRPSEPIPEVVIQREFTKIAVQEAYKELREANPSAKAEEALSAIAEKFEMDVEKVSVIIRLAKEDNVSPAKTADEPDIVSMWFEWLALRKINSPKK